MESQYSITIVKRVPKSEEELDRIKKNSMDMFHHNYQGNGLDIREYNEREVLCTVLTESEFLNVRAQVLKNWDSDNK